MAGYNSTHKGSVIDATVSAVIAGKAGLQGVKVNGTEVTPDPDTNKVDLSVPNLLNSTGQSTTAGMTQKAITDAIGSSVSGVAGVKVNGVELEKDDANKVDVPVPVLQSTTGSSTTAGMTQNAITTALADKVSTSSVVQSTGTSTTNIMSQKAVTDAIGSSVSGVAGVKVNGVELTKDSANKVDVPVPVLQSTTGSSTTDGMTQSAITTALSSKAESSSLSTVATSGDYDDLLNKPTIPTLLTTTGQSTTEGMTQKAITDAIGSSTSGIAGVKVNGVELEKDSANKVDVPVPSLLDSTGQSTTAGMTQKSITDALGNKADSSSLSTVATSGDYDDLSNKPTIPTLLSTTGSSTTDGMTQNAITTALSDKVSTSSVVQSTGTSTTNIMSQDAVTNQLNAKATVTTYSATLSTSWTGSSAPYTQTVSVSGILSTDVPIVDVVLSSTTSTAISQLEAWSCVSKITTSSDSITATCLAEKPTSSIPIQLLVVR